MTDAELFQFADVFKGLERVFPKRLEEHERQRMSGDYFKILRKFPLPQVQAGAEAWMQRGKYFPKPAEWIDAMPRRVQPRVELETLSSTEADAYRRAERLRYEDAPCGCRACREAGVHEKPIRFVPEFHPDGSERRVREGEREVTAGHWAHGAELFAYYQAKADFYEAYYAALQKVTA